MYGDEFLVFLLCWVLDVKDTSAGRMANFFGHLFQRCVNMSGYVLLCVFLMSFSKVQKAPLSLKQPKWEQNKKAQRDLSRKNVVGQLSVSSASSHELP